jgi:hypothetical protein
MSTDMDGQLAALTAQNPPLCPDCGSLLAYSHSEGCPRAARLDPGRIAIANFSIPAEWAAPMLDDLYQANRALFGKLVLKRIGADRAGKD